MAGISYTLYAVNQLLATAQADCLQGNQPSGAGRQPAFCETNLPTITAGSGELQQGAQIFFGIIAAVAVLMIVIAGLRLVTAQGNPQETAKARGTIIYALIGLVVALLAEAIVSLVLDRLS